MSILLKSFSSIFRDHPEASTDAQHVVETFGEPRGRPIGRAMVRPAATAVRSPSERALTGFLFFFVEWMIMDVDHLYLSNVVSFELVCERMN
jgi:hypothetical protein